MKGTMMQFPLTLTSLFERAGKLFPTIETISRRPDNSIHRCTYSDIYRRARALADVLQQTGIRPGDRVATLMWNHSTHLEAYFAIPIIGGVLHTLNLRLHPDELAFIINHAEDRVLIVDDVLLPLFEKLKHQVKYHTITTTTTCSCSRAMAIRNTPSCTKMTPPACATPPEQRENRRALSIPIVRSHYIPTRFPFQTTSTSPATTLSSLRCPCSMPMLGASPTPQ